MQKFLSASIVLMLTSNFALAATEGDDQAVSFADIDASLCPKHLNKLDALREKLKPLPKLPAETAQLQVLGSAAIVGD